LFFVPLCQVCYIPSLFMQRVLMCHVLFRNFLTTKNSLKANELPPKPFIEATEADVPS
jgi:hypothetical protein